MGLLIIAILCGIGSLACAAVLAETLICEDEIRAAIKEQIKEGNWR